METETKYKLFRLCCLMPFYFGLVLLLTHFSIKGQFSFDSIPPRLSGESIITTTKLIFEQISLRLFAAHLAGLILYFVISFPFLLFLAGNLYKCYPSKRNIILLLMAYFLLPTVLLFYGIRI